MRVNTHVPKVPETARPCWNRDELASESAIREDVSYSVGREFLLHRQAIEGLWNTMAALEARVAALEAVGWTDEDVDRVVCQRQEQEHRRAVDYAFEVARKHAAAIRAARQAFSGGDVIGNG